MQYLEEIAYGRCFSIGDDKFILTSNFCKKGSKCISLMNGNERWFPFNTIINPIELYIIDNENNFEPVHRNN